MANAILYKEKDFKGTGTILNIGNRPAFIKNPVGSIKIPAGLQVGLYKSSDFQGGGVEADKDIPDLSSHGLTSIGSVKVVSTAPAPTIIAKDSIGTSRLNGLISNSQTETILPNIDLENIQTSKMPTWGWVAIGVGAFAVIGTIIFLIKKHK